MRLTTTIANSLWTASNAPAWARFRRAIRRPQAAQGGQLRELLRKNAHTAFGKAHGFASLGSYEDFSNRVPLSDYTLLEPWIARIRRGEEQILTNDRVTRLVPTSG